MSMTALLVATVFTETELICTEQFELVKVLGNWHFTNFSNKLLRVGRIDVGLYLFISVFVPDLCISTTRDFLSEFRKQPIGKYRLVVWANKVDTKDLILLNTSTEYVSSLFLLLLKHIKAILTTVADTEARRKGSREGMSAR